MKFMDSIFCSAWDGSVDIYFPFSVGSSAAYVVAISKRLLAINIHEIASTHDFVNFIMIVCK